MADSSNGERFDSSRAELFEVLGHPVRIKILESLENGPLGFADLKRRAGLESSGNLQFHLGKLGDMVSVTPEGNYALTDEGREALRVVSSVSATRPETGNRAQLKGHVSLSRSVLALLVAALILASSAAVYEQYELRTLQTQIGTSPSTLVTVDTCGTEVTFNGTQYCSLDVSAFTTVSVQRYANMNHPVKFMGVLFQTVCPSDYEGCPSQGATLTVMTMGVVKLNLTFGDGTNETVSVVFADSCPNSPVLTQQHLAPQAGFYLDCVTGSPVGPIKLILLVEAGVLYNVTFQQDGVCSPEVWIATWSVTVGNQTIVLPEGTPLPLDDNSWASTENQSLSAITFALPDGSYTYQVHPSLGFASDSGVVEVSGRNVVIHITPVFICTTHP